MFRAARTFVAPLALLMGCCTLPAWGAGHGSWRVVRAVDHDHQRYTQGLELHDGLLYESAGLYGRSAVYVQAPGAPAPLRWRRLPDRLFAEGLTRVGDRLFVLSWREQVALVLDERLRVVDRLRYRGEGWGLCHDGQRFVMSNGSARLLFRDTERFDEVASVIVRLDGRPLARLNELECVDGRVYANVFQDWRIVRIDPDRGTVDRVWDLSTLALRLPANLDFRDAVLNGIAHDPATGRFWITGKRWPLLFEVELQ